MPHNIGALNTGSGQMRVGTAIGQQNHPPAAAPAAGDPALRPAADIGVITVLDVELRAVVDALRRNGDYDTDQLDDGSQVHIGRMPVPGGALDVVALQALDRGPRSATVAYHRLRRHYRPSVVLLVGIAGGIRPGVAVGDVVIADTVVYYDARREAPDGAHRRGQSQPVPPVVGHRLNDYFRTNGAVMRDRDGARFAVHRGPVGSGDAVVTDADSSIRSWLTSYHEKTLAVETELAGVVQAFHEEAPDDRYPCLGWLAVRGISDRADAAKGYSHHQLASDHAALVLVRLLPFLRLSRRDK